MAGRKLPRAFYDRPTVEVASDLVGCLLVRRVGRRLRVGRIVETEAYCGPEDLACHASRGRTPRTEPMFGPPGHAYVYLIYGMYHCLNAVTEREGYPAAVLIRALEPADGAEGFRGSASGPGRLCRAMRIDLSLNRADLCGPDIFVLPRPRGASAPRIRTATRVGVAYAGAWAQKPWRFFDAASNGVSARPR